ADLISLAALPALVIGLATLTSDPADGHHDARRPTRHAGGIVIDSCLLVMSMFVICLVTAFGPDYVSAGSGPGAFTFDLIRPAADLIVIGLLLPFVVRAPRQALLPLLALGMLTIGDCLAVGSRVSGHAPGAGSMAALLLALGLLGAAPAVSVARPA